MLKRNSNNLTLEASDDCHAQLVFCTCPDFETAKTLAEKIVASKLAACLNIVPGLTSLFNWGGKMETAEEVLLILKTTSEAYTRLEATLLENHPYDCPEIIGISIQHGYRGYLKWIKENVSQSH